MWTLTISSTPSRSTATRDGSRAMTATATGPPSSTAAVTSSRVTSRTLPWRCSATTNVPLIELRSLQPFLDDLLDSSGDVGRPAVEHLRSLLPRRHEHAADAEGGLPFLGRRHDLDLFLLGLLDRAERRVAGLVDARLDRQQGGKIDLRHVDEPALELAVDGGAGAACVPLDPRHDGNAREPEELGQGCAGGRLHGVARLDSAEDEIRRLALHDGCQQPRQRDRIRRARAVDADRAIRSHGETAPDRALGSSIADGHDDDLIPFGAEAFAGAKRLLGRVRIPLVEGEVQVVGADAEPAVCDLALVAAPPALLH